MIILSAEKSVKLSKRGEIMKIRTINNKRNRTKSEITFETLESITKSQRDISNWLLLYSAEKTARKQDIKNKEQRKKQLNDCKKIIMPNFNYSTDFKELTTNWWVDEIKWFKEQSENFEHKTLINALLYRLQLVFFRNYSSCLFYKETKKGNKPDAKDFSIENQKLFKKILNHSIKIISSERKFKAISDTLPLLKKMKKIDITKKVYSASHKILGKDWRVAKGAVMGAGTGVIASIFLGPVVGGYIGNLAGFSGAAATSYGLAFLGGGSLVAGGFGMAGGSFVLGLGFGITNGVRGGIKGGSIDMLNQMQAERSLPLLLAVGRFQFENRDKEIPKLIHKTISKRLKEFESRLKILEKKYDKLLDDFDDEVEIKNVESSISLVEKSIKLYEEAKYMSVSYDWLSGYDICQEVKTWVS